MAKPKQSEEPRRELRAKVFRTGRSQAVRLPKEVRFPDDEGEVRVWRDGNKDDKLDRAGEIHEGWYGINIHRAGSTGTTAKVGRYSAGCQVFQNADDFALMISLAKKSSSVRGNKFTYTLLEEADLK